MSPTAHVVWGSASIQIQNPSCRSGTDKGSRVRLVGISEGQARGAFVRGLDHLGGVLLANASPVMQMTSNLPAQTGSSRAPYRVLPTLYFHKWYAGLLDLSGYAYDPGQVCRVVCVCACVLLPVARAKVLRKRGMARCHYHRSPETVSSV